MAMSESRRHSFLTLQSVFGRHNVKSALEAFQMQPCTLRIALPHLSGGRRCNFGIDRQQRPPRAHRLQLHFRCPLEIIKIIHASAIFGAQTMTP